MLIDDVRPTTLAGIKSFASQLRRQKGIKYANALDIAAQAANCTNFRNAQRTLPGRTATGPRPYVLLTTYWYDRARAHARGRETLRVELAQPLPTLGGKSVLRRARGFGNLRMVADDHFVCNEVAHSQAYARERLSTAERSIRFMERTGLRPLGNKRRGHADGQSGDRLPDSDHATDWIEPASGQIVVIDEPCRGVPDEAERSAWADHHRWCVAKTSWPGMYYPHRCDLYVATAATTGYDFAGLIATIEGMPEPLLAQDWSGESVSGWATFVSPMAKTPQDARRARCPGTIYPTDGASTVPVNYAMGTVRRRPKGGLGILGHRDVGGSIKAVLYSPSCPYPVSQRMNQVRSILEDWLGGEIDSKELAGSDFFDVYYHDLSTDDPLWERAASIEGTMEVLSDVRSRLTSAYPDCAPLRGLLHRIDMSLRLLRRRIDRQA